MKSNLTSPVPTRNRESETIRVLVVDDSAFMRLSITNILAAIPGIQVVGSARNGKHALEQLPRLNPDVVTMDVEMPVMDGLTALREIMHHKPLPVVMLSSLTHEGTVETVHALTLGAVDFIAKPDSKANLALIQEELAEKIFQAADTRVFRRRPGAAIELPPVREKHTRMLSAAEKVVVIGSSTGGPRALAEVLPNLPKNIPAALLVVQHMPAGFTRQLAERLNDQSQIKIKEAEPGDRLEAGLALIAPGGFHTVLDQNGEIALNQNPTVHGVRPAVDVALTSVVEHYGARTVSVILTGMGRDGSNGAALVSAVNGRVLAEAQESCVVFGMPRSVIELGVADQVVPLNEMAAAIQNIL